MIGCGNIMRGDDAVGPVLIRHLHLLGAPEGVRLVDGGTSGMDVAFGMRGADRVVIVDASSTGVAPGTVYRVPAEELAELPPIDGLHTHNFRWDHALSFSSWLLGPLRPTDVTVFLIEAGQFEPASELSEPVTAAMEQVLDILLDEFYPEMPTVELTDAGYLHMSGALAARYFPADVCVARLHDGELVLTPLAGAAHGGMVLKQCNADGDRSLLISEVFGFSARVGRFEVVWDEEHGALRVLLESGSGGDPDGDRGRDRSGRRAWAVGRLPAGADAGGNRSATVGGLLQPAQGAPGGRRGEPHSGPATPTTEGSR